MSPDGFELLVHNLTEPPLKVDLVASEPLAPNLIPPDSLQAVPESLQPNRDPSSSPDQSLSASARPGIPVAIPAVPESAPTGGQVGPPPAPEPLTPSAPQPPVATIGSVPLHPWERQALQQYSGLIQTPRGAKRFLNTYRLVRAGLTAKEWDEFRKVPGGPQEFRLAMLLLAVAAGQPSVAREWFARIRSLGPSDLLPPTPQAGDNPLTWAAFCNHYNQIRTDTAAQVTPALLEKWLARVERFTF